MKQSPNGSLAPASATVSGKFDGIQVTDAVINGGSLNQLHSTQAAFGPAVVGKSVIVKTAGAGNGTLATTFTSVSAGVATMAAPASQAVSAATAVFGTDDTAAWATAYGALPSTGGTIEPIRGGISLVSGRLVLPAQVNISATGKSSTVIQCIAAGAGVSYGPAFGSNPFNYGGSYGYSVDGGGIATQPLFINAVNGTFTDMGCLFANGEGVRCGGQNSVFTNFGSGGHSSHCVVLDNGCGDYTFLKPEFNFTGGYHLCIRSSQSAEGIGYGIPKYNYFEDGIFEQGPFSGAGLLGNVLMTAGRFNTFKDMNFYVPTFAGGARNSAIYIAGANTGLGNPDTGYNIVGDAVFDRCTWTSNASGTTYAIEADNRLAGAAAPFFEVIAPYFLTGTSVIAGFTWAELIGTNTPGRREGNVVYA